MFKIFLLILIIPVGELMVQAMTQQEQICNFCEEHCNNRTCEFDCNSLEKYATSFSFCNRKCQDYKVNFCKTECTELKYLSLSYSLCVDCIGLGSEVCFKYCNTTAEFSKNENICLNFCKELSYDVCEQKCVKASNRDVCSKCGGKSDKLCNQFCDTLENQVKYSYCDHCEITKNLCTENCKDNSSFQNNFKFCSTRCHSFPTKICTEKCSTPSKFAPNYEFCIHGCEKYRDNFCQNYCSNPINFLENRFYCMKRCFNKNIDLCRANCTTKFSFLCNYQFCSTLCSGFPSDICSEECNTSEKITINSEFCKRGCSHNVLTLCEEKCFNVKPSEKDLDFCDKCYIIELYELAGGDRIQPVSVGSLLGK